MGDCNLTPADPIKSPSPPRLQFYELVNWMKRSEAKRGTCIAAPLSFILSGDWNSPDLVPGGRALLAFDCDLNSPGLDGKYVDQT